MIYFSFTEVGDSAPAMNVLDATEDGAALEEAKTRLRDYPSAARAHVYNGDQPIGSVEAPAFGFAGVNNTIGFGTHASDPDPAAPISDSPAQAEDALSVPTDGGAQNTPLTFKAAEPS